MLHFPPVDTDLFKEIICDGTVLGKPLPRKLRIVAACNPYRMRKRVHGADDEANARVEEGGVVGLASGICDPHRVRSNSP